MGEKGKGVANVARQTWDKEYYEKKAQMRATGQLEENETKKVIVSNKEEFLAADASAAGPAGSARAFLKARVQKVSLEGDVGTVKVMKGDDAAKSGGYYCEVCEASLKDSVAYLDHINGKRHLRKLGFSMRVERSTVDQVKNRLQSAAKRKWDPVLTKKLDTMEGKRFLSCSAVVVMMEANVWVHAEYEKKLKSVAEEEARAKKQRREEQKKAETSETTSSAPSEHRKEAAPKPTEEAAAPSEEEAAMMTMMGFGSFGGSSKA